MTAAQLLEVPCLRGLPFVGSSRPFARDPLGFLAGAAKHGPVVELRMFGKQYFFVSSPELVHEALVRRAPILGNDRFHDQLRQLTGNGVATNEDPSSRRSRMLVSHVFASKRIAPHGEHTIGAALSSLERWSEGQELELRMATAEIASSVVARSILGEHRAVNALTSMSELWKEVRSTPLAFRATWLSPKNVRFVRGVRAVDGLIDDLITRRRETGRDNGDVLSALVLARDEAGAGIDDRQIRDECMMLSVASQETSGLGLMYTLHLLARHPAIEAGVREELGYVLGGREPTTDDLPRLDLTHRVVREALRLYPPVWVVARTLLEDATLGGHSLPKGATLIFSPWVTHRDGDVYPDPHAFRPERWARPKSAYLPFGAGHRVCIANHFAMMESVLTVATLLQKVRLECLSPEPLSIRPSLTLDPAEAIWMRVRHDPIDTSSHRSGMRYRAVRAPIRRCPKQLRRAPKPASSVTSLVPERRRRYPQGVITVGEDH